MELEAQIDPEDSAVRVEITALAFGGDGVGKVAATPEQNLQGITAFVPFTIPGEQVEIEIQERQARFVRGEVRRIVHSSPARVAPVCRYFSQCGGCELQHMNYEQQLSSKRQMLESALRAGGLSEEITATVREVVPSEPFGYRGRVKLHLDPGGRLGFYRVSSHQVIALESCAVAHPAISSVLASLQVFAAEVKGLVGSLNLENDAGGVIALLNAAEELSPRQLDVVVSAARRCFADFQIIARGKEVFSQGRQELVLAIDSLPSGFLVPAGSFSQNNYFINRALVRRVLQYAEEFFTSGVKTAYDFYSGAGNFALPLASLGFDVTAVETERRLVRAGCENAKRNGLTQRVNYHLSSVEKFLSQNKLKQGSLIVADPPRSGLGRASALLGSAAKLMLISCHLPSLVKDLKELDRTAWQVQSIEPFDMFAQTTYLETLVVLARLSS